MEISIAPLVVSVTFLPMKKSLGSSGIFFLNAGFALFGVILLYFILSETKGVKLERINNGIQLARMEGPQNEDMGHAIPEDAELPQNENEELPMLG